VARLIVERPLVRIESAPVPPTPLTTYAPCTRHGRRNTSAIGGSGANSAERANSDRLAHTSNPFRLSASASSPSGSAANSTNDDSGRVVVYSSESILSGISFVCDSSTTATDIFGFVAVSSDSLITRLYGRPTVGLWHLSIRFPLGQEHLRGKLSRCGFVVSVPACADWVRRLRLRYSRGESQLAFLPIPAVARVRVRRCRVPSGIAVVAHMLGATAVGLLRGPLIAVTTLRRIPSPSVAVSSISSLRERSCRTVGLETVRADLRH